MVDISNENMICDLVVNNTISYSYHYAGSIGGKINGKFVFCGGFRNHKANSWIEDKCFDLLNPTIDDAGHP